MRDRAPESAARRVFRGLGVTRATRAGRRRGASRRTAPVARSGDERHLLADHFVRTFPPPGNAPEVEVVAMERTLV
ncbi:hypothetical protein [Streptomyces sp. NPDC012466]|uniref:hypothetical protein n=1 Tax=Streptomyces sp. NPDC012466 TaxID=3364835 RepID=UPI0036E8D4E6